MTAPRDALSLSLPAVFVSDHAQQLRPGYPWVELGLMKPAAETTEE